MALKIQSNQVQLLNYLSQQQSNRQFNRLLEISFTMVVITLFIFFAVRPSVTTIASLFGQVKAKELFTSQMRSQINKIVEAQDIYASIQSRASTIDKALGSTPDYSYIKNQLLWLASNSQISIEGIDFPPNSKTKDHSGPLKNISARFVLNSSYESIIKFLSQINLLKKANQLTDFSVLLPAENKTDKLLEDVNNTVTNQLDSSFSVNFYYWFPHEEN